LDEGLKEQILTLLSPVLASLDVSVLDITRQGPVVRVVLDREDALVGIDDCTEVSRFLSHALDVEDIIPGRYRLEVSSPGLDRPLMHLGEFRRFTGSMCRVNLLEPLDGNHQLVGRILGVEGEKVILEMANGSEQVIDHDNVAKARLEIEF
jgi:ribosome maturation factor RimP